jgi:hypothetical protein
VSNKDNPTKISEGTTYPQVQIPQQFTLPIGFGMQELTLRSTKSPNFLLFVGFEQMHPITFVGPFPPKTLHLPIQPHRKIPMCFHHGGPYRIDFVEKVAHDGAQLELAGQSVGCTDVHQRRAAVVFVPE